MPWRNCAGVCRPSIGGVVKGFIGLMRDMNQGDAVSTMKLEHYPGMTEKAWRRSLMRRPAAGISLACGSCIGSARSAPGDPIVLVCVASAHRGEGLPRLRVHHRLSEDAGTILEA